MNLRIPILVSALAIAAMLALAAWGWSVTPSGAHIAVHWGMNGRPNRYMTKEFGFLVIPGSAFLTSLLLAAVSVIEPRRANLLASRKLYLAVWYGTLVVLGLAQFLIVMTAAGLRLDISRWMLSAIALLMIVLGNYLGKSRSTFFIGLRLPWTLSSELAWTKSNRLAGVGVMITGIVALVALFLLGARWGWVAFAIGMTSSVVTAGAASYFWWKRDPHAERGDSASD